MNWLGLLGSFAGVLALAAVAWWLGLGRAEPLTREEVAERAQFEFGPFVVRQVFVDREGLTAAVFGDNGRLVLFKKHGTQPASRLLSLPTDLREQGDALLFPTGDRRFGDVTLRVPPEERDRLKRLM